jgi:hypothetical protein
MNDFELGFMFGALWAALVWMQWRITGPKRRPPTP